MKLKVKNKSTMTLLQMLRRRRTTLAKFMLEQGITTYDSLVVRCQMMGVTEPTLLEFGKANMPLVSNPEEGVVIIDPIPLVSSESGEELEKVAPRPTLNAVLDIPTPSRKRRKTLPPPESKE